MIRKITVSDKPDILAIAARTWEGEDYIPFIIDEWLEDNNSEFVGLWEDGKLVAFGRMKFITPHDIWLEGLRKDPDSGVRGVGKKLTCYFLTLLKKVHDIRSIRFTTYFDNKASIHFNEQLGFRRSQVLSLKNLELKNYPAAMQANEDTYIPALREADAFIRHSRYFRSTLSADNRGLLYKGWIAYPYSITLLEDYFRNDRIICIGDKNDIKGILLADQVNYPDIYWISLLAAENDKLLMRLLELAANSAKTHNNNEIQLVLPQLPDVRKICADFGFKSWETENDYLLYEFPLDKLAVL
ncbi:MAG: GNAT family N-acetyltransferase [Candidatus Cloacimonetes bacterium]|nr:GNAT family N-acetyltransferase [Candidatus Cloacimonadota bacterium]